MSIKAFSSTKLKVILSFSLLAFGLITAIYFSLNSFNQISSSVETLAQPNQKSVKLNQLLTDVSEAESQIRAYSLTQEDPYLQNYESSLNEVFSKLDTLRVLTAYQPWQRKRIDSIGMLMEQKINGLNKFMELKAVTDRQTFSAKALSRLENGNSRDSVKVNKALRTTHRQVEENIPSLPRISIEANEASEKKGFFNRLFGTKSKRSISLDEPDSNNIIATRTEVSIDTIVINQPASDTLMLSVRQMLQELQHEENIYRRQLSGQELAMLQKDQAIMDQIRQMIRELEREEALSTAAGVRRARSVANKASVNIFLISCAGLLSSLIFMVLIVNDITRSNYYKKSLELARQRSEHLRQIKEQFLANMSHEIRTPLNAIIGFTEQLRRAALPPQQKEQIKAISSSSDFLLAIVTDILDLSKIEAGQLRFEKKDFELRNLIEETCYVTESKALNKDILLTRDFPEGNFFLLGDPFRLQQILYNLLSNAIKFTDEGEVYIRFDAQDNGFGKYVVSISVQDTGIGISQEQLPYIFENFTQADATITRKYGGTGLGLAITKKLVELQGGQITVESKKGEGSTFNVTIPFPKGNAQLATAVLEPQANPESSWSGKKVLLVEDDSFNALLLKTILNKWGIKADKTDNGFQAIEKLKEQAYDLILTDIHMPGMSGMQLLKEVRGLAPDKASVPVVAVTANAMRNDLNRYLQQGMNAYLLKPYSEKDLMQLLSSMWNRQPDAEDQLEAEQSRIGTSVDKYTLKIFNEFAAGDPEAFLLLLQSFLENTSLNIEQLHELHQEEDYANLSELAHKMFPTFKHLNADRAAEILKEIEFLDPQEANAKGRLSEIIQELSEEVERVVTFVEEAIEDLGKNETVSPGSITSNKV